MRKQVFLMITLFLVVFSFKGYAEPILVINTSNVLGSYNSSFNSSFSVIWTNSTENENITECNFTLGRPDGNITTYATTFINSTIPPSLCNISFTQDELGPAGNYNWSWSVKNDTYWISNQTFNFTINKASTSINLTIDGFAANKTYNLYQNATFTASLNVDNKTIYLNSTCPFWTNLTNMTSFVTNTINLTSTGLFSVTAYWDGNENYSLSNKTYFFNVTDLNFSGSSATPASDVVYSSSAGYNFSINLTGSVSNVTFESDFINGTHTYTATNATTYNNIAINKSGNTYWIAFPPLAFGTYQYRWIANDTNNVWINTSQSYVINSQSITPSFVVSGSSVWTTTTATAVTLDCSDSRSVTLTISPCPGTLGGSGNHVTCAFTTLSTSGSTLYTCTVVSGNYTGQNQQTLSYAPFTTSTTTTTTTTTTTSGSFTIVPSSSSVTMEPGSSKIITITLRNTLSNGYVTNINLTVSGLNASWYNLDKTNITRLRNDGGNETVQLTLNVPNDTERKTYAIVFTASGKDFNLNKITRQTTITLTVPEEQTQQNETESQNMTNATVNETNITSGSQTTNLLTGLSIKPEDIKNIVLFIGLIAVGLVFLFRSNITEFLTGGLAHKVQTPKIEKAKEESKEKKASVFSSIKNKLCKLNDRKLVIQVKKKDKEKA
jgi:hypothetical protein